MLKKLSQETFVCIDCEATGLDPKKDRIIEVAVVIFDLKEVHRTYESLIDPQCEIPETSIEIHNITSEMVLGQPEIEEVLPQVLSMIGDHIIVGHGVDFDVKLLNNAAKRAGVASQLERNLIIDTLRMARRYGESPVNSLQQLREHFCIEPEGAHRAMSDVIVNIEVFRQLARDYKTTKQIFDMLAKPIALKIMPLGPHKGRPLKEVPMQFLQWAAHKDFDQDLLFTVRSEIKRRKKGGLFGQATNPFLDL